MSCLSESVNITCISRSQPHSPGVPPLVLGNFLLSLLHLYNVRLHCWTRWQTSRCQGHTVVRRCRFFRANQLCYHHRLHHNYSRFLCHHTSFFSWWTSPYH